MTSAELGAAAPPVRPAPLKAHRYPVWLLAFAVLVAATVVYSAALVPPYLEAFVSLRRAEAAIGAQNRSAAEERLLDVLRLFPSSKFARLDIAVLLLGDPSEAQQRRGLDYLKGVTLDKHEWQKVSAVLPEKFRGFFSSTKR